MATILIDGCTIHYELLGQGVPIVLTPGGRAGRDAVRALGDRLAGEYQVLLWDRRNTGASDVVIGNDSEQATWADDLARLLKELGLAPAYIAGGSAGCRVSLLTAIRHPGVVRGLVLWSASGGPYGSQYLGYQYHVPYIQAAQGGGMEAVIETPFFAERIAANPSNRERLLAMDPGEFARVMKRWNASFYYREETPVIGATEEQLRAIRAPTVLFEGNDDIHPEESSDALHRLLPHSELAPSPWSREDFMAIFTRRTSGSVMDLYPRLAGAILDFLSRTEDRLAVAR